MDRKSCRARKSAASVASVVGLAAALALAVPTTASAAHHDRNCGNFDHADQVFGGPFDGHNRHRPMPLHMTGVAQHQHHDQDGDLGDDEGDSDGAPGFAADHAPDADHHASHDSDSRDDRGSDDHHGDNRSDSRGDHHGDNRDDRRDDRRSDDRHGADREPSFHDGEISRDEGGNRNCDNFDHKGKQFYVPPGLFDGPDRGGSRQA